MQKTLQKTDLFLIAALVAITASGAYIRLQPAILSSFPLNDGGLFYTMILDLKTNAFVLPQTTSYNLANIPYAYPPLTFYLTGLLSALTGWQVLDILRILPGIISTLTIPAFFLLARETTGRTIPALLGSLTFAMIPRTFEWQIMGGGITRSFGFLFAILAIWQGYRFMIKEKPGNLLFFIILSVLVVYSHPEAAVHVVIGISVLYLVACRSRKGLLLLLVAAAAVAVLSAPWWATILQRDGLSPFLAASTAARQDSYNPLVGLVVFFRFYFTDEPFTSIFASLGLIGLFRLLSQRSYPLPAWFFMAHLLEPRGGTLYMMIPLSIAAGLALDEVLLPALDPAGDKSNRSGKIATAFVVALFFYGTFSASFASSQILNETTLKPTDRAAMEWVKNNTSPDSKFILVTGENALRDASSEWFPALTSRRSQATIFGYEWVNDGRFSERTQQYTTLQNCAFQDVGCLETWSRQTGQLFNYVYLRTSRAGSNTQAPLAIFLQQSARYRAVYTGADVDIFEHLDSH